MRIVLGKLNPQPRSTPGQNYSTTFVPAGTEQERKIAEIWQELLGIQQIGIHDDFFELGGHSLMIVTVHSRVAANSRYYISGCEDVSISNH